MNPFLAAVTTPLVAILGLAMLWEWWTALLYMGVIFTICFWAVRVHEKHNRGYMYDDRISNEQTSAAIERFVRERKESPRRSG